MSKKSNPDRIPYDHWINSQLSIARFYGGCVYNGDRYALDYDSCENEGEPGEDGEMLYKPDLVRVGSKDD